MTRLAWIPAACALAACSGSGHHAGDRAAPAPTNTPVPLVAPISFGAPQRFGTPRFQQGHVQSLAFVSPTGLDVLSWDGVIAGDPPDHAATNKLARWDLTAGKIVAVAGSDAPIIDAAFAPAAHVIAVATLDGDVELRDDRDFATRWKTPLVQGVASVTGVAISPDGARVLVGDEHGQLYLLDGASGAIQWHDAGLHGFASVLAFSPSGRYVAVGGHDDDVLVLDGRTHALIARLHHPAPSEESDRPPGVLSLAFTPDEDAIATGGWDDTIRVFALPSGASVRAIKTPADPFALAFTPDGAWLLDGDRDHDIAMWRARDGAPGPIVDASPPGVGDNSWKAIAAVAFSPDGKTIASGSWDGTFRTWDLDALTHGLAGLSGQARLLGLARDGATMISVGQDARVIAWDVATGAERAELPRDGGGVAIAPDASAIAHADDTGLAILELPSGKTRVAIAGDAAAIDDRVALSSDGARVLAQVDGHLRIYDAHTGSPVTTLAASVAWSLGFTDGDRAVWWLDQDLHVVDATTGKPRATLAHPCARAALAAVSPDGRSAAVLCAGGGVSVWDVATGARRFTRDDWVRLAWMPDGRTLAIAIYRGPIEVVDAATGNAVATVRLDAGGADALATGAHGEILAGGDDGAIELWRPQ